MNSQKGEGAIRICVFTVLFCMLLSLFLTFASTAALISQTRRNVKEVLDHYVVTNAIEIFDSIKTGSDETTTLHPESYRESLISYLSLREDGETLVSENEEGDLLYAISIPTLELDPDRSARLLTRYTMRVPLYFSGQLVTTAEVPITIRSRLLDRYAEVS